MAGPIKSAAKVAQAQRAAADAKNQYKKDFERGTTTETPEVQMQRCADLEEATEVLRVHYEHYFLGLIRKEPSKERDLVKQEIMRLKTSFIRNTGVKFRVQSLHNKFLSYERMWMRTVREIEEGTYRRDIFKAKIRKKSDAEEKAEAAETAQKLAELKDRLEKAPADGTPPPAAGPGPSARDDDDFDLDVDEDPMGEAAPPPIPRAAAPAARPPPRPAPGPARSGTGGGLTDDKLKAIYDAYMMAKRRCKESTTGLTFESLSATLKKQMPTLLDKHKAKAIDFKVVIKGGKAILKAVPK